MLIVENLENVQKHKRDRNVLIVLRDNWQTFPTYSPRGIWAYFLLTSFINIFFNVKTFNFEPVLGDTVKKSKWWVQYVLSNRQWYIALTPNNKSVQCGFQLRFDWYS